MSLVTANDDYQLIKAPRTGRYYNAATEHTAWYSQGALMPPEYELVKSADTDATDIDADRLAELVAAEQTERQRLEQELAKAKAKSDQEAAERARVEDQIAELRKTSTDAGAAEQTERQRLEQELAEAKATIASLQAGGEGGETGEGNAGEGGETGEGNAAGDENPPPKAPGGETPRARRRRA